MAVTAAQSPAASAPIGPWSTAAWGVLAILLSQAVEALMFAVIVPRWRALHPGVTIRDMQYNGYLSALILTIGMAIYSGVVIVAVKRAGQRVGEYLGLVRPPAADMLMFVCALGVLTVGHFVNGGKGYGLFTDLAPQQFSIEAYRGMAASGMIVMLLASVVAAPIGEEILYRGFLYRGFVPRLGVACTIVLTSAIFAATHLQYDLRGIMLVFGTGLLFGGFRWASGSTLLSMLAHAATNISATIAAGAAAG